MQKFFRANSFSLYIIQMVATVIAMLAFFIYPITISNILMIIFGYFVFGCIGISVFYHRYLSHYCFKTNKIIEHIGVICGVLAGRGSPIGWVAVQRLHHMHSDTDKDPHQPIINDIKTFRFFFPKNIKQADSINPFIVRDLLRSKFHLFVNDYYNLIIGTFSLGLLIINPMVFVFFYAIPVAITAWMLNIAVYAAHKWGYTNYATTDQATNNWLISLLLWGEGWHNNHHYDTKQWNLRHNWWEIDPCAMVIRLIKT
jgi:fatty-acid desaturase